MDKHSGLVIVKKFLNNFQVEKCNEIIMKKYGKGLLHYEKDGVYYGESFGGSDEFFDNLLQEKLSHVQSLVSFPIKPECSYARIYKNGGKLEPHVDRPPLDITASISLKTNLSEEWPIFIEDLNGNVRSEKILEGDAIIFLGNKMKHWREPLICENNQFTTKLFLHWIKNLPTDR
jgi:alkylated DNA repair dioxygenase AlkB